MFKFGDRVAVYTTHGRHVGTIFSVSNDNVMVMGDNQRPHQFHKKQCRKLKKKIDCPYDNCYIHKKGFKHSNIP